MAAQTFCHDYEILIYHDFQQAMQTTTLYIIFAAGSQYKDYKEHRKKYVNR
jgi:hypothetical protein